MTACLFWNGVCVCEKVKVNPQALQVRALIKVRKSSDNRRHRLYVQEMIFSNPKAYGNGLAFFSEEEVVFDADV